MTQEFSNTDSELSRWIKSRMRHQLKAMSFRQGEKELAMQEIREYMQELCLEIISEEF